MAQDDARIIAVAGATGLQGGAVTRSLLRAHWRVRALTRNPDSTKARALAQLGAEVVKADMADPSSLERAFDGVHGVFSVQNHHISGYDGEVRQGRNVAEVAKRVGVTQLVYSGAGTGVKGSGIGSRTWPASPPRRLAIRTASWDVSSCWPATSNPSMRAGLSGAR